jgi:hypothetical protein
MNKIEVREKYIKEGSYFILAHALNMLLKEASVNKELEIDTRQAAFHGLDNDDVVTEDVDNYVIFKLK